MERRTLVRLRSLSDKPGIDSRLGGSGDHAPPALYSWALNDDSQAHGGREFPDLAQARWIFLVVLDFTC